MVTRAYWENYIDSLIDSIIEDKGKIIDLIMSDSIKSVNITMCLDALTAPIYDILISKNSKKSPFGESEENDV